MQGKHTRTAQITLNVGGKEFKTSITTITAIPGSLLSTLTEESECFDPATKIYSFDKDSSTFKHILEAHRSGEIHLPRNMCPRKFQKEMEFWGIPQRLIPSCCWKAFYEADDEIETLNTIMKSSTNATTSNKVGITTDDAEDSLDNTANTQTLREKIWLFLEEPQTSRAAKVWCFIYIFMVLVSVTINLIWVDESLRSDPYLHNFELYPWENMTMILETFNEKVARILLLDPHLSIFIIDVFCIAFFALETIVHFTVCPNKRQYIFNFYNVIKASLSIFMIASLISEVRKDLITTVSIGKFFLFLRTMSMLRILLILRLRKLYNNFHIIILSLQESGKELLLLVVVFLSTVVVYGGVIFVIELDTEMFSNTRTCIWWALITMTTVGYGDYYPTTSLGYVVGALCALNGLVVIALPIAAIASNFANICSRNADYQKYLTAIQNENTNTDNSTDVKKKLDCDKTADITKKSNLTKTEDISTKLDLTKTVDLTEELDLVDTKQNEFDDREQLEVVTHQQNISKSGNKKPKGTQDGKDVLKDKSV